MESKNDGLTRNSYRTSAAYEMNERHLILRGGPLDGQSWTGTVAVGRRVFCGTGPWSADGLYLVTEEIEVGAEGTPMNVAVPALA